MWVQPAMQVERAAAACRPFQPPKWGGESPEMGQVEGWGIGRVFL